MSDLKDRVMENNQTEQKKEIIIINEKRLREVSDAIKGNNICITEILQEENEKGAES